MLTQMGIRNFALIEQMNLQFLDGITIFTGETGAGKSILMDAFSILLGERASSDFIRHGKDAFVIEGVFDVTDDTELLDLLTAKNILVEENQLIYRALLTVKESLLFWLMTRLSHLKHCAKSAFI